MFLIVGQTAGLIGTKLAICVHLDPGSVSGKLRSRSRSERHTRDSGGTIGVKRDRGGANSVGWNRGRVIAVDVRICSVCRTVITVSL